MNVFNILLSNFKQTKAYEGDERMCEEAMSSEKSPLTCGRRSWSNEQYHLASTDANDVQFVFESSCIWALHSLIARSTFIKLHYKSRVCMLGGVVSSRYTCRDGDLKFTTKMRQGERDKQCDEGTLSPLE